MPCWGAGCRVGPQVSVSEIAAKLWKYLNRNQPMTAIDPKRTFDHLLLL